MFHPMYALGLFDGEGWIRLSALALFSNIFAAFKSLVLSFAFCIRYSVLWYLTQLIFVFCVRFQVSSFYVYVRVSLSFV